MKRIFTALFDEGRVPRGKIVSTFSVVKLRHD